jgi:hypothetical protein
MKRSDAALSTIAAGDLNTEVTRAQASVLKSNAALDAVGSVVAGATGGALAASSPDPQFTNQSAAPAAVQATPVNAPVRDMPTSNTGLRTDLNSLTRYG